MQSYNTYYTNLEDLKLFIKENNIENSQKLLCQVFTSQNNESSISEILYDINSLVPNCKIIGATTDGEIMNGNVSSFQTVISFTIFNETTIETIILPSNDDYIKAGEKIGEYLNKENLKLIISFIDGLHGNGEDYLKGISNINKNIKIAGGMAADNSQFKNTFVFNNDQILENGVVAIGLYSKTLNVYTGYSFDWVPVGRKLTITKSNKNIVYEIDNKSAYDTYKYYLGEDVAEKLPDVGIEFPLVIEKEDMVIARAVLGKNKDNSLTFGGNFDKNEQVRFAYGYNSAIFAKAQNNFERLKNIPAETIFIYSCMARKKFLQNSIEIETKPYNNIAPTSGFFTYGEFFTNKSPKFLNQTLTKVVLSENPLVSKLEEDKIEDRRFSNRSTLTALTHFLNVTTSELNNQKEELKMASKAKDDFLANMSHELKTPLNSINVISSVMQKNRDGTLDEKKLKNLEVINKSGKFLLSLINDILDISKLEAGEVNLSFEKINIIEVLDDIFHMFEPQMNKKNINFNFNHKDSSVYIFSDEGKIKQIVKNLLSNSVKFTNYGSIDLNFTNNEETIEIEVKDDGIGIPEEKLDTIFDRFKQVDESTNKKYGGTGLGLSITKELLKILEGSINVESQLNVGTIFRIKLPKNLDKIQDKEFIELIPKKEKLKKILIYNTCAMNFFKIVVDLKKDFEIFQVFNIEELEIKNQENYEYLILDGQTIDKEELTNLINNHKEKIILLEKDVLESLYATRVRTINSNDIELLKTTLAGEIEE